MLNVIGNTIQSGGRAPGPEKRNLVQHIIANRLAIDYDRAGQRDGTVQPGRCYKFEGGQGIDTKVQLPLADDFELSFDFVIETLPESGFEEDPISQYGGGAGRAMFRLWDSGMCFFINGSDGLHLPVILGFNKAKLVHTANVFSFTLNNNTDNLVYSGTIEDTTLVFGQRVLEETTYCFHGLLGNIVLKDANGNLLHHWQCNESTGDTCYDSVGNAHGQILNATPAFHAVDNRFANLQNIHGYTDNAGQLVPVALDNQGNPTGKDVFGGIPTHRGKVRLKPSLTKNCCGVFDGNGVHVLTTIDFEEAKGKLVGGWFKIDDSPSNNNALWAYGISNGRLYVDLENNFRVGDSTVTGINADNYKGYFHLYQLQIDELGRVVEFFIDGVSKWTGSAPGGASNDNLLRIGAGDMEGVADLFYKGKCASFNVGDNHVYGFTLGHGDVIPDRVPTNPAHATLINAGPTFWGTDNDAPATNLLEGHSLAAVSDGVSDCIDTGIYADEVDYFSLNFIHHIPTVQAYPYGARDEAGLERFHLAFDLDGKIRAYIGNTRVSLGVFNDGDFINVEYKDSKISINHGDPISFVGARVHDIFALFTRFRSGLPHTHISHPFISIEINDKKFIPQTDGTILETTTKTTYYNKGLTDNSEPLAVKRIPSQVGATGKDIYGQPLTNPPGYHNGAETCIHQPECPELNMEPWAQDNVFQDVPFEDLPKNQDNQVMNNSNNPDYKKNQLTYSESLKDGSLRKTKKYLKQ